MNNSVIYLNVGLAFVALLSGLVLLLTAYLFKRPVVLDFQAERSTSIAYFFWLGWWASFIWTYYTLHDASFSLGARPSVLLSMNTGDLCLLAAAIAYCSGDRAFGWRRLTPLPIALGMLLAYHLLFMTGAQRPTPLTSLWLLSPSAVLANVAVFMLGWAFLARWGSTALPLFFVTTLYAMVQYPAYLEAFVAAPFGIDSLKSGKLVFYGLASGKLFILCLATTHFLSPSPNRPDMTGPKLWPSIQAVPLHPKGVRFLLWFVTTIGAGIVGAIITATVRELLQRLGG